MQFDNRSGNWAGVRGIGADSEGWHKVCDISATACAFRYTHRPSSFMPCHARTHLNPLQIKGGTSCIVMHD